MPPAIISRHALLPRGIGVVGRPLRWLGARAIVLMLRLRNVGRARQLVWLLLGALALVGWFWMLWTAPIAKK